jgi:hypothetical protein
MDWYKPVRHLRGECQHADIQQVLKSGTPQVFGELPAPLVPAIYSMDNPKADTPIVQYAITAADAVERLMMQCLTLVTADASLLMQSHA